MKKFRRNRRIALVVSFFGAIFAVFPLLNFTVPNPTGRWSSSEIPPYTANECDWRKAEVILSSDLKTQHNQRNTPSQLVCSENYRNSASPYKSGICVAYSKSVENKYHIPDFITSTYIADSKCQRQLIRPDNQIQSFVDMANTLNRPLFIYARADTLISPEYRSLIQSTRGDIVPYFTVPGYVDPSTQDDQAARFVLIVALFLFALTGLIEAVFQIGITRPAPAPKMPVPETPKSSDKPKRDPAAMRKALHGTNAAEAFLNKAQDSAQRHLDQSTGSDLEDDNDHAE